MLTKRTLEFKSLYKTKTAVQEKIQYNQRNSITFFERQRPINEFVYHIEQLHLQLTRETRFFQLHDYPFCF
jgi:hypothetical protein